LMLFLRPENSIPDAFAVSDSFKEEKMKKKLTILLAGITAAGMLLAGCGGNDSASTSQKAEEAAKAAEAQVEAAAEAVEEAAEEATAEAAVEEAVEEAVQEAAAEEAAEETEASGDAIVIGVSYVADNTNPVDSAWDLTAHGISEGIYMQDENGNLVSRFVTDLERKDDLTWEAKLTNAVKFSDGTDCDAQALADCMNYLQKENSMTNGTAGVCTFTAIDGDTLQIVTERPITTMDSLLCEWCNIVFKQDGDDFIFTGPYMVEKLDSGVAIDLVPNPYYDEKAADRSPVTLKVFRDSASMQQAFEGGEIDIMMGLTPEVAQILSGEGYTVKDYDAGYQYFTINNIADGAMSDPAVRTAINTILNREDMVAFLGAGRVANGMFAQYYPFAGDVVEVCDVEAADAALEAAGYTKNDAGIYEKDGQPVSVKLVTYSARADLPLLMQMAASELTEAGIDCTTEVVDDIGAALTEGAYDIAFYAQHTAPSGEPGAVLNMFFVPGGSRNYEGYESEEVNELLDKLAATEPGDERNQIAKDIQAIVAEDLPVYYLVDPQWHVALSDRVADYVPYCGDYYVVNANLGL